MRELVRGIVILIVLPAIVWFVKSILADLKARRRERRQETGHCVNCDYDLTGNSSGRCPECGREISDRA